MNLNTVDAWVRDERKAKAEGRKLSWRKWLERHQRDCNHDFRPMYSNMNDAVVGTRCCKCGKVY
jgi:hypothetical protein